MEQGELARQALLSPGRGSAIPSSLAMVFLEKCREGMTPRGVKKHLQRRVMTGSSTATPHS